MHRDCSCSTDRLHVSLGRLQDIALAEPLMTGATPEPTESLRLSLTALLDVQGLENKLQAGVMSPQAMYRQRAVTFGVLYISARAPVSIVRATDTPLSC